MANKLVAAQGIVEGDPTPEVLLLKDNKTWSSPPGGWMAVQSGKWEQISKAGVALQSKVGGPNVFMAGFIFESVAQGATGQLRDQVGGGVGTWKVVGTSA